MRRRRRANWRPPPASTSARSAAIRKPSARNAEAFEGAIAEIAAASARLDGGGRRRRRGRSRPLDAASRGRDGNGRSDGDPHAPASARARRGVTARPWWVRPGLDIADGRLRIVGHDAEALARERGTPLLVYDRTRFAENARALQAALGRTGLPVPSPVRAQGQPAPRGPRDLPRARRPGDPGERRHRRLLARRGRARPRPAAGARTRSATPGTNVSERDLDVLLAHGIHLNLDAISQIERYGRRAPGTAIGLRIDPGAGAGYNEHLEYAGDRPTKFGIGLERLDDAIAAAAPPRPDDRHGPLPRRLGLAGRRARRLRARPAGRPSKRSTRLRAAGHPVAEVNVGGGLGAPAREDERAVDLDAYAAVLPAISVRSGSRSRASQATCCPRTRRSCSARS